MTIRSILLAAAMAGWALCAGAEQTAPSAAPDEGWHTFEGSWSASGTRYELPTDSGRDAVIVRLSGAVVLTVAGTLGRGFQGQAIGFDDGRDQRAGRAVWTDTGGDQIFSTLAGASLSRGQRFTGTITGGTGRFAGITGEYAFTWQYVVVGAGGAVQGRAADLTGRVRRR